MRCNECDLTRRELTIAREGSGRVDGVVDMGKGKCSCWGGSRVLSTKDDCLVSAQVSGSIHPRALPRSGQSG